MLTLSDCVVVVVVVAVVVAVVVVEELWDYKEFIECQTDAGEMKDIENSWVPPNCFRMRP